MKIIPCWVKGGSVLVSLVGIIVLLIFFLLPCAPGNCFIEPWMIPLYFAFPIYIGFGILLEPLGLVGYIIASIIFYFLIGAIIGWIYGKIKNRKKDLIVQ